jgi:hypothetical protein
MSLPAPDARYADAHVGGTSSPARCRDDRDADGTDRIAIASSMRW